MPARPTLWIHAAAFTYRLDEPERLLETIWCERSGWGYIRRRDLWVPALMTPEEAEAKGLVARAPLSEDGARLCPYCSMYIVSIPGSLVRKHFAECGGGGENWQKIEDIVTQEQRVMRYEAALRQARERELAEQEEMEKRERFDKIKEENLARQQQKDRKARLRRETREELRKR